jgi:hypothetical protein
MSDDQDGRPGESAWADQPLDDSDERVLGKIASVYSALDPVPDRLVEDVVTAIALESLDEELAELQSQLLEPAGARGGQTSQIQSLTFSSSSLVLLIKVTRSSPDHVRIDGWAAPGAGAVVELVQNGVSSRTVADQDGQFVFDEVAHAPTSFVVRPAEPARTKIVRTPTVTL